MSLAYAQSDSATGAETTLKRGVGAYSQVAPVDGLLHSRRPLAEGSLLEALLKEVGDLSTLSPELLERAIKEHCWYHVTPFRSAHIRALDIPPNARVLEVGCGGGALTRYLGEQGFQVVALETSEELAECARTRCKELRNVEVITGFLENVLEDKKFDYVICIDPVLVQNEYFDPGVQLLSLCKKMLKATGTMILAVANPLHNPGGSQMEPSSDQVRGKGASLEHLKNSLNSAGFAGFESYMTFPHHAAPRVIVNAQRAREERVQWLPLVRELYQCSESSEVELDTWWRSVHSEQLENALAPGWLVLAHAHNVHSVLWKGAAVKQFCLTTEQRSAQQSGEEINQQGFGVYLLNVIKAEILPAIVKATQPIVNSIKDYKFSLMAADGRIADLATREQMAREQLVYVEDRYKGHIEHGQEELRVRKAELDLVLTQYHAVGAMCHDMREEGRKLQGMVEEIKRRYLASEEWGAALADRVVESENELHEVKASWGYRFTESMRELFSRRKHGLARKT